MTFDLDIKGDMSRLTSNVKVTESARSRAQQVSATAERPARRAVTRIVLHTKVDAQCDKLAIVVDRTKMTTPVTVDGPWRNFSKSRV